MESKYIVLYSGLSIFMLYTVVRWITQPFSEAMYSLLTNTETFLLAIPAVCVFLLVAKKFDFQSTSGKIWGLLATGLLFWLLGEISYISYEFLLGIEDPYLFIGDAFWLLGYIPLFIALLLEFKAVQIPIDRKEIVIFVSLLSIFVLMVSFTVILPMFFDETVDLNIRLLSAAYPLMDIVLLFFTGLLFLRFRGGKIAYPWMILLFALIASAVADTWYSFEQWFELYPTYFVSDILFDLQYAMFLVTGVEMNKIISKRG